MLKTLPAGALTEASIQEHVWPLFSRVLEAEAGRGEIYLANHSLGRPLDSMATDISKFISCWYNDMDSAWPIWQAAQSEFCHLISSLLGLPLEPNCIVPKTSAGQGLRAVLNSLPIAGASRPVRVVATRGEFDSADFILKAYAAKCRAEVTWVEPRQDSEDPRVPVFHAADIEHAIAPGTDLLVISQVFFTTGQVLEGLAALVEAAHEKGALVLLDTYHSLGVIPLNLLELDADFAVGGCYKYLRGGPGSCFLALHPRHLGESALTTLDTGWFAKRETFDYQRLEVPERKGDAGAWAESTPPIITAFQALSGLRFTTQIGVDRLRAYGSVQKDYLHRALEQVGLGERICLRNSPHGAFILLESDDARGGVTMLKRSGLNVDSRGGFIRLGPDLLTSSAELDRVAEICAKVLG